MSCIHPLIVQGIKIPTNVFFAPINPGFSRQGSLNERTLDFHINHSGRDIGVYYVGNVSMKKEWISNDNTVVLLETELNKWKRLAQGISKRGSLPGIQLAWKPELIKMQRSFQTENLDEQLYIFKHFYNEFNDIDHLASIYIKSINSAITSGFRVIQLHAAHGYALSLLLSRSVSGCKDPSKTKGAQLLKTIFSNVNKKNNIIDVRVSLYEGIDDTKTELEYKTQLFHIFVELGFDIISLSNGFYNIDKQMIYPPKRNGPIILEDAISITEQFPNILWNVAGNMEEVILTDKDIPNNLSFSIGRQLMADPDTVIKIKRNQIYKIQKCSECGACHYYSYNYDGIRPCKKK